MTTPLTDPQSAAIEAGRTALRARFAGGAFPAALGQAIADDLADVAMAPLLASLDEVRRAYVFDTAELKRENACLRAELERARAEGRAQVIAELRTRATGPMLLRVLDQVAEMFPAPACSCRAEAVHQAGCDTDRHA